MSKLAVNLSIIALVLAAGLTATNHAQGGWFERATGHRTPERIRKIAPNGIQIPNHQVTSSLGPDLPVSVYYKIQSRSSGLVLDVPNGTRRAGARIIQWGDQASYNQRWRLVDVGGGYVKIVSVATRKALDVPSGSRRNGVEIVQWDDHGGVNQHWRIVPLGNGYMKIVSRSSGKVLDVPNGSRRAGAGIIQWVDQGSTNQQWRIVRAN